MWDPTGTEMWSVGRRWVGGGEQEAHVILSIPTRSEHWGSDRPLHGPRRTVQLRTRTQRVEVEDGRAGTC